MEAAEGISEEEALQGFLKVQHLPMFTMTGMLPSLQDLEKVSETAARAGLAAGDFKDKPVGKVLIITFNESEMNKK